MKKNFYWLIIAVSIAAIAVSSLTIGKHIYYEERLPGLYPFSIIHFSGYLFFLLMPVELLFVFYAALESNIPLLIFLALSTAMLAQIIDYAIGNMVSSHVIDRLVGRKRYQKSKKYIRKYGNLTIFVFNLTPMSSPILSLAAGMVRYRFWNFIAYSFAGLFFKYLAIALFFL